MIGLGLAVLIIIPVIVIVYKLGNARLELPDTAGEKAQYKDKPYHSWLRVKGYLSGEIQLTEKSQKSLKDILRFAFC